MNLWNPVLNWRSLPAGREKYAAYLASRDWAERRMVVIARSGGRCEMGCGRRGEQVHHQTYLRVYHEDPADLIHLCRFCHDDIHHPGQRQLDRRRRFAVQIFWLTAAVLGIVFLGWLG